MSDRFDTSEDDTQTDSDLSNEEKEEVPKSYHLEFCMVKLKNDLNIFERRRAVSTNDSSLIEDITKAVYFRYGKDVLKEYQIYPRAENEEKYPETHSRKYFFLPQQYMKEGNEAEVSELYTNLILRMKLEKPVTVVQVEPADYKAAFENDPNLVWFANQANKIIFFLNPVICMFSEKDQMDQFYAALAARNRDYFMNKDPDYLLSFVYMFEKTVKARAKEDSFRDQHIEALSAVYLRLLKTSSYIPGHVRGTEGWAKRSMEDWIDYMWSRHEKYFSNCPVFEELQVNLFHLHLTRLVYHNYFTSSRSAKPVYWNPSQYGWVICEVIEANLIKNKGWLEWVFMKKIFQQPCFRRLLKDEQLRKNFGNFILHDCLSIKKDEVIKFGTDYNRVNTMETLFKGNYDNLMWHTYFDESTFGCYMVPGKDFLNGRVVFVHHSLKGLFESVMDTIDITTVVLAMYPEEKGSRRKDAAKYLLKYLDNNDALLRLRDECIISEEKETDNFKEMQELLATCFRLPDEPSMSPSISDISSELPLDRIYKLYCQSKEEGKEVNPSAGFLWLGIAHRQAIGSLGDLSEEQQTNCLEMLASALDDLPLQTIETFLNSIQGFTTQKTVAADIPEDKTPQTVDNTADKGKKQTRAEIEQRITAYIAQRKKEETAVLFLLHSEIGIKVVKVNANMARYEKNHSTSAGIFIFMTLFEYNDKILEGTSNCGKKTFDYYVLTFTKYLINNSRVKDIFNKKSQLRHGVWKHIKSCLKHYNNYEQLNDLLKLDWQTYYNRWVAEKPVIGTFDLTLIQDKKEIGYGGYGTAHICSYPEFVFPIVYKQFSDTSAFHSIVRELNSLMKVQSHPHVVRIFGVVTDTLNKAKGLMLEYCEGGSLDQLIKKSDYTYDGKKTVHWMAQAASALIFFQKTGVVHLDIKPANMLLCKDHHYLKISDMGITLLAEIQDKIKYEPSNSQNDKFAVTASKQFTVTARKIGTYGFMAPEMGSDKEKMVCSYASDIFSLGRTLWSIYYGENPWDEIVNQTVIMPVFKKKPPIFDKTDIPEDEAPQAVENITADMETTLEQAIKKAPGDVKECPEKKKTDIPEDEASQAVENITADMETTLEQAIKKPPDDVKLECPKKIAKWIIRMTRFNPDARPTAAILHEEFKKQYEKYERKEKECKRLEKEGALKDTMTTLQITPSTKITFVHPIEDNQSVVIKLGNTSKTEILQWFASSSNEKIAVVPAEGEILQSEEVKVKLTYKEKSVVKANMGNFIVNYRLKMDPDEPEKEWPWASKHLKIVCNL